MKSDDLRVAEGKRGSRKVLFQSAVLGCLATAMLWAAAAGSASAAGTWFRVFNNASTPVAMLSEEKFFSLASVKAKGGYWETTLSNDVTTSLSLYFVIKNKKECKITLPAQTLGYEMVEATISDASGDTVKADVRTIVFLTGWNSYGSRTAGPGPSVNCIPK